MELTIRNMAYGERPNNYLPDQDLYNYLGEEGVRKMISDHYDLLVKSPIKHIFPDNEEGLNNAKKNSADFMVQRLGGPDYYNKNRGNPMLVRRHAPFAINAEARITWLECYREVILKLPAPDHLKLSFWNYIHDFSNWMVNVKS